MRDLWETLRSTETNGRRQIGHGARALALALLAGLASPAARADHEPKGTAAKPVALLPGMGQHRHPIATKNPEAQKFFDQGLTLLFGFNHPEAVRSFRRAAELDPTAVMPLWGIALGLGPNYNRDSDPVSPERNQAAYEAVQKALALSAGAPPHERAYAQALAKRYSIDPKADGKQLEVDYSKAMGELARRYPDDLDAATLYAEALMNLRPWQLWDADGKPAEGTEEIVRVLEVVLERHPEHPGALHYHIHALEASPYPQRARLSALTLMNVVPGIGHLVHMPGHIFMHTGDYELSAVTNERAVKADEDFLRRTGTGGVYRMMYYPHNIHFVAVARAAQGKFDEAKRAADKLAAFAVPHLKDMPMLEGFLQVPLQVLLRFHRWDDLLQVRAPESKQALSKAFWHFARASAYAAKGQTSEAATERQAFETVRKEIPVDAVYAVNSVEKVLEVAAAVLDARLAGDKREAIQHWEKAVRLQDALKYGEPPDWYYPVRESLGAALLRNGQPAEAEAVFRADLRRNRRNGRSLFGLLESLKAQKKTADAAWVRMEYERAWKQAAPLRIEDF
jgi:tetratricopeptide (TPR) repeat protein